MNPNPDAQAMLQFWLILGLVSFVISNVVLIISSMLGRKQRREVNFAFEPASKDEFDRHVESDKTEHAQLRATLEADRASLESNARVRSAGIYGKIDVVRKELTDAHEQLRGEVARGFQDTERALGRIEGKIDSKR